MKVAFICGPYRSSTIHGVVQNIRQAESYAIKYWKNGYAVICPHMNTALLDGLCEDKVWLDGVQELLKRSDVIVCIPGWKRSSGSLAEFTLAVDLEKEIIEEI